MHGIGLEMASKPSSGTPKGALEGLCGWRIEATWAFDEVYAVSGQSEGRFRARTRFAGHFRADSVHGALGRVACRAVRRVESNGGAHRAMRRPAPRVARPTGSSRPASLCRAARPALRGSVALRTPHPATALSAPRSADLSRHVPSRRALLPAPRGSVAHLSLRGSVTSRAAPRHRAVRVARLRCDRAIYRAVFTAPFSQRLPQESMMAPSR